MADGISIGKVLNRSKVIELKEWLKIRGVKTSGKKKADLIKRYVYVVTVCLGNFYQLYNPCSVQECLSTENISVQAL